MKSCRYYHFLLLVIIPLVTFPRPKTISEKGVLWTNMRPLQVDKRDSHLYVACWSVCGQDQDFWSTLDCLKLNAPSKALDHLSLYRSKICTFLILCFSQFAGFLIAWFNLSNYNCGIILKCLNDILGDLHVAAAFFQDISFTWPIVLPLNTSSNLPSFPVLGRVWLHKTNQDWVWG